MVRAHPAHPSRTAGGLGGLGGVVGLVGLAAVLTVLLAMGVRGAGAEEWVTTRSVANATEVRMEGGERAQGPGRTWPALLVACANFARAVAEGCDGRAVPREAQGEGAGTTCVARGWVLRNAAVGPALVRLSDAGTTRVLLENYSQRDPTRFGKDVVMLSRLVQRMVREANAFVRAETDWTRDVLAGVQAVVEADEARATCAAGATLSRATAQGVWKGLQRTSRRVDDARAEVDLAAKEAADVVEVMKNRVVVMMERDGLSRSPPPQLQQQGHDPTERLATGGAVRELLDAITSFAQFARRTVVQHALLVRSVMDALAQVAKTDDEVSSAACIAPPVSADAQRAVHVPHTVWQNLSHLLPPTGAGPDDASAVAALRHVLRALIANP
jgi:hypothetical protein